MRDEDKEFHCHVCGSTKARQDFVSQTFEVEGKRVLVERIPATVCARCDEPVFSADVTELVRRMIHGEVRPVRTVTTDVFAVA
jgi:YgiT-type zinc finger domain-containing protein